LHSVSPPDGAVPAASIAVGENCSPKLDNDALSSKTPLSRRCWRLPPANVGQLLTLFVSDHALLLLPLLDFISFLMNSMLLTLVCVRRIHQRAAQSLNSIPVYLYLPEDRKSQSQSAVQMFDTVTPTSRWVHSFTLTTELLHGCTQSEATSSCV
jgi:hypothetical protein